jgi:hypothetical protein
MNPQFANIAAEARGEIAFWPVAAGGYLFVQTESWAVFIILLITLVPSAVCYLFLKEVRQLVSSQSDLSVDRSSTSSRELTEQVGEIVDDLEEAGLNLNPIIIGLNGIFSIFLYIMLTHQILIVGNVDIVAVGLFLVPLVTLAVAVTPLVR